MAVKSFVKKVGKKAKDGSLTLPYSEFGVGFENVVDTRRDKGNYSLAQFFDNYMDFMKIQRLYTLAKPSLLILMLAFGLIQVLLTNRKEE